MIIAPLITRLEKLTSEIPWFVQLYSRPYIKVVEREIRMADITHTDKVINIGCGAIPFTAVILASRTGARVKAVDYDPRAVQCARQCVAAMGLAEQISVYQERGETTEADGFTAAVVALQARPKRAIIDNLRQKGASGIKIIARCPKQSLLREYEALPVDLPVQAETLHPEMRTFDSSVLFV